MVDTDGEQSSSFVVSETRVTPLKTLTIPRLELLFSVLRARLMTRVVECLSPRMKFKEPTCFTNSRVVFYWIRGAGREWKLFVQNCVDEIRRLLPVDCWSRCPGKENPADIPTRGLTPSELRVNRMWKDGPPWLKTLIDVTMPPDEIPEMCVPEIKTTSQRVEHSLVVTQSSDVSQLIDIKRFGSIHKLYRTTANVLKFIKVLRREATCELTQVDLFEAERLWIISAQIILVQDQKFDTWKRQFSLFQYDRQIWRCGGRLHHANLSFSSSSCLTTTPWVP